MMAEEPEDAVQTLIEVCNNLYDVDLRVSWAAGVLEEQGCACSCSDDGTILLDVEAPEAMVVDELGKELAVQVSYQHPTNNEDVEGVEQELRDAFEQRLFDLQAQGEADAALQ